MTRKYALKCYRYQRMGHRVKYCTIPKRKKDNAGRAEALGTLIPKPVQINHVTSVWDEFPEIARPERADHVTSVWDEAPKWVETSLISQQGFLTPKPRKFPDND